MQDIGISIDKLPKVGYYRSKKEQKEKFYHEESHIHEQNFLTGIKTSFHKLHSDIFTYFPKGFKGSKNSDFYEFLSLGTVPYLIGSAMLIASYALANPKFLPMDRKYANKAAKSFGAGVILYGLGKVASRNLSRTLINSSTNVNLNLKYLNKVNEIPEPGFEKGLVRVQYPGVYDSSEFPRIDLLSKDSEINHGDRNYHSDKIAEKLNLGKLNSPDQLTDKKAREVKVRATALENILGYIPAVLGVALGSQEGFANLKYNRIFKKDVTGNRLHLDVIIPNLKNLKDAVVNSCKQLWKGDNRNFVTKNFGKALIIAGILTPIINWLIPTIGFKHNPNTIKSKVDTKKEYEVC